MRWTRYKTYHCLDININETLEDTSRDMAPETGTIPRSGRLGIANKSQGINKGITPFINPRQETDGIPMDCNIQGLNCCRGIIKINLMNMHTKCPDGQ